MLKLALSLTIVGIALFIINAIFEIAMLVVIAKICFVLTVICIVIKLIIKIFGLGD